MSRCKEQIEEMIKELTESTDKRIEELNKNLEEIFKKMEAEILGSKSENKKIN